VFHSVKHGFLPDTQQVHLYRSRKAGWAAVYVDVDLRLATRDERLDNLRQCGDQISILEQLAT
jgi:hypothetical protein